MILPIDIKFGSDNPQSFPEERFRGISLRRGRNTEPSHVQRRQEHQRQQSRDRQAAHDRISHRPPENRRSDRKHAKDRRCGGQQDGTEAMGRRLDDQFPSKEDIFREMLEGVSTRIGQALPPGIETQGDVENVLRLIAKGVLAFQAPAEFIGLLRMTIADTRQFPWIATAFDAVLNPYLERFTRYLSHLASLGVLDCPDPLLAAQQFLGLLNGATLWPKIFNRDSLLLSPDIVIDETVQMFLLRYRPSPSGK